MLDEEELQSPELDPEDPAEGSEGEAEDAASKIEERLVALEQAQQRSVQEIRSAVGRVQSIAAQLDKTNNPQVEAKLHAELAGVSELLGLVTDSIDESILPRDVKRRVSDAQAQVRAAANDAEINRRIAEATRQPVVAPDTSANDLEAAVVAQIQAMGLNDQDPAFDWTQAARILANQGAPAMWKYFGDVEKKLLSATDEGPIRRPRTTSPRGGTPAAPVDNTEQLGKFADDGDLDKAVALLRSMGVNA